MTFRQRVREATITVIRSGEEPFTVVRYFHAYERLSLDMVLDAGSIDVTKHVLEVGDELVIAIDRTSPAST